MGRRGVSILFLLGLLYFGIGYLIQKREVENAKVPYYAEWYQSTYGMYGWPFFVFNKSRAFDKWIEFITRKEKGEKTLSYYTQLLSSEPKIAGEVRGIEKKLKMVSLILILE